MRGIKFELEIADISIPRHRVEAVSGIAATITKEAGGDVADAMMVLAWAAMHVARENGLSFDQAVSGLQAAIPHAARCEREIAASGWGPLI